jgi:hypothetical protein
MRDTELVMGFAEYTSAEELAYGEYPATADTIQSSPICLITFTIFISCGEC